MSFVKATVLVSALFLSHQASAFSTASLGKCKSYNCPSSLHQTESDSFESNTINIDRRDVLKKSVTFAGIFSAFISSSAANAGQTYLTDPTEEFKASEIQRAAFKKEQMAIKNKFVIVLERLTTESNTEQALVIDLNQLTDLVIQTGGLPIGIKKEAMFKQIRVKKRAGPWPTKVEIAYQSLVREISYQQSPNTEKDSMSPL